MKVAKLFAEDGSTQLVTATGEPLGHRDGDRRILHILPKLFLPSVVAQEARPDEVDLSIEWNLDSELPGPIEVRQPYPNWRYFVGGTETLRNGIVVDLPEGVTELTLTFKWCLLNAWKFSERDELYMHHTVHITLLPGEYRSYTMDTSCWPWKQGDSRPKSAVSLVGFEGDDNPAETEGRDVVQCLHLVHYKGEPDEEWVGSMIEERLAIPAIAYEQIWSLTAHEEPQLHEIKQLETFTVCKAEHEANATVNLPASLFLAAVKLARMKPLNDWYESLPQQKGGYERHPALSILNKWWEENRPTPSEVRPGHVMPWIRVEDNTEYWCGNTEMPGCPIEGMQIARNSSAKIGDSVLVTFMCAADHFIPKEHAIATCLADGTEWSEVGVGDEQFESGEFDEAWYGFKALSNFPWEFEVAYKVLKRLAAQEEHPPAPRNYFPTELPAVLASLGYDSDLNKLVN